MAIDLKSIFNRGAGKPTGSPSGRHTKSDTIISTNDSEGQISLNASKTILHKAPTIKIDGETTSVIGILDLQCIGGHTSIYSHMSDVEISDGSELEIGPGTVLSFIDKVKKMAALFS